MDLPIFLDRNRNTPLKRQLYDEIRGLILGGQWAPGYKLPSSRILAEKLEISRPIITWAFEQLLNEGYIQTFAGSGTYVSRELPDQLLQASKENICAEQNSIQSKLPLSRMGNYLHGREELGDRPRKKLLPNPTIAAIDFRDASPSLDKLS